MSFPTILIIGGLLLALIEEYQAQGRSLVGWYASPYCRAN
jgi:hypothetical protein